MKKLIPAMILLAIFMVSSCDKHKKTVYVIADWTAILPTNLSTYDCAAGWVRMMIYTDSLTKQWKLNSDGDTVWTKKYISDTTYLLRTPDDQLPLRDSTGKVVIDPATKLVVNYLSWRTPKAAPKEFVFPLRPIPAQALPALYQPVQPDTTHKAPAFQRPTMKPAPKPSAIQDTHK